MKKVLITMSVLAIALATAPASQACGAGGCSIAPNYSSYNSNYSSSYAYGNGYNSNFALQNNGSCCGAAAPIYSYYVPLAPKCCTQAPSCCGAAAPCNCGCGCKERKYFNFFRRNNNCGCGCGCNSNY